MRHTRLLLAASAATLIIACAKKAEDAAVEPAPAETAAVETEAVEPMVEAATVARTASASVEVGIQNGAPYFASAGYSYSDGSSGGGGIVLGTGDVDISGIPPGDVNFTITLNADAVAAGYSFPSDPYQAIAIVVIPPGVTAPAPQFGQQYWSAEFDPPTVSGNSLMFVDQDEYADAYEYSIGLNGPNGRVVMDPEIKNGGTQKPPAPEPEPVPQ